MGRHTKVVYREIQRPRSILWWVFNLLPATFMWYWFIQQTIFGVPMGNKPAPDIVAIIFWVIFGIVFPVFMLWLLKLIIEVRKDGIYLRFVPFHFKYKQFLFEDINDFKSITYSPLERFGGWGVRINSKDETAYIMNGKEGIELRLRYNTVVIGTQKPAELKNALNLAQRIN
ncbi:hypothetical protein GMD78_05535 [Ornithinibacillus sp. L9]|uniref:Uncharacterized protein n=1 Tax=Ornithinibacillus caprae TaxID=2678566 RepID=A0A6N8FEA4_9BACI|nr:hypothetical protein [Ornithinibacillus caprae]